MKSRIALLLAALASAFQTPLPAPSPSLAPQSAGQSPGQSPGQSASLTAPPPAVAPYAGTVREGRAELQRLAESAKHEEAAALAESVFAKPEFSRESEAERAEFWFATGVARGAAMAYEEAVEASHAARGLAGSSGLGQASAYNAGTFRLMRAEQLRLEIPEIREKLELPPLNAAPTTGSLGGAPTTTGTAQGGEAPDALQIARGAYLLARADLVERWRADPSHADTRANLELVQRRLRELDELESEREKQQQENQDQQKQQDPNQQKDPNQDPQQNQKQDPNQDPQQDPSQQEPPKDDSEQQEPKDPKQDQEQEQQQPKPDEDSKQSEDPESKDGADAAQPQDERTLTPEEVQRLMQQLDKIDDQARQVQAALRRARRTPVKKDW